MKKQKKVKKQKDVVAPVVDAVPVKKITVKLDDKQEVINKFIDKNKK